MNCIKIELDHDQGDKIWHPGDIICGRAVYQSRKQLDINSVCVTLECRMKTEHVRLDEFRERSTTYNANVILFSHKIPLLQGFHELPPTMTKWPFQFQLPTDCREAQGATNLIALGSRNGGLVFDPTIPNRLLNQDRSQQLPPTMYSGDSPNISRSPDNHCYVRYRITVELKPYSPRKGNLAHFVDLRVQPYRWSLDYSSAIVHQEWKSPLNIKSYYLNPEFEKRSLTIKEKMKSAIGAESVPEARMQIIIKQPNITLTSHMPAVIVGLSRYMDIYENPAHNQNRPEVTMKSYKIMLHPRTDQLVPGSDGMLSNTHHVYPISEKIVLFSWTGEVVLHGEYDLRETCDRALTSSAALKSLVPSFGSFIIGREYFLSVDVTVECLGQKNRYRSPLTPLVVLPREGLPPNMFNRVAPVREQLPSYESALNSKPVF